MDKNKKLVAGVNTDLLMKGALLVGSAGIALIFSGKAKKNGKKKNKGFIAKTKSINSNMNALCQAFYVNKIKKDMEEDGFPVKLETAEIIEI